MFLMEVKLHEFEKIYGDANKAAEARRQFLERVTGVKLENIGKTTIDLNTVVGKNIENVIGAVQIPVGVAGPLLIKGDYANGYFYIPLATTEGALVASVNRGAKIITESGGTRVKVLKDGMTRAPLFKLQSVIEAIKFVEWVYQHFDELKKVAESTTKHGKLKEVQPFIVGNYVWLRFVFSTGDAMGMNMVTIATDAIAKYISEKFPEAKLVALSGNMCVDKKANAVNFILGRGKTVIAEALIKRDVLEKFGVSPEDVHNVNVEKNLIGSALAHSYGFNAHFANIIAAIFIATGQDVAQVVESSMGITTTEPREEGLYISVFLPSLEVGTVGGGTGLPTQREALELLGVAGPGNPPGTNALKFAEIVASAVLAGELNLLLALTRNELASAHQRLGRAKGT
ncbi:3-hydroxy-3-methylglutaryl-coenzyme A reductase [Pyrobaculum islandicum DSM 4184]|uniref:3-hydroxy-3-methylglutaryl coenzyme A reductase n=1 Tax=Pyrobaculum islandicum (strain DSM 4184 / JCM 9189 / GEO3) TaxID=384616 RepID=A1RSQ8_PYRIL|nr:hydroxymethylglutaryl-CoA reductase (NADPH) [Pyrobaculum islandicum]ABL87990.1 3-hydroxy-3-methylglutaryl-coenzyme A reductase [Pyrobaculum islandicum DSM 4184]